MQPSTLPEKRVGAANQEDEAESDTAYAWEAESREKQWLPTIDVRSRKGRDIDGIEKDFTACRKR